MGALKGPPGTLEDISGVTVDNGAGTGSGDIYVWQNNGNSGLGVVDLFNSAGEYQGALSGTPAGGFGGILSVAVDPKSHDVYVGTSGAPGTVDVFGPDLLLPEAVTGVASSVTATSATLNGTVELDKAGEAKCGFEWGTTTELGREAKCEPEAVTEEGAVAVHARLRGVLTPDTIYYYRLRASGVNGTSTGETLQFKTPGPGLDGESVSEVASTAATLGATINPDGYPTSYYFQYSETSTEGCTVTIASSSSSSSCPTIPAPPGEALGSAPGEQNVSQRLQGLTPGREYHYRVVVVSEPKPGETEVFKEADQTFTTEPAGSVSGAGRATRSIASGNSSPLPISTARW